MVDLKKITILTSKTDANAYIEGVKEDDPYINIVDGQFEKRFQQLFEKCLPEKSISFDIGANIGIISVILGTIRPEGRVFSFEGGQHVCEVLRRNVARNLLKNVNVSHCAIANYNGVIHFNENSAYGHAVDGIDENAEADQAGMTSVPCFTVDELVARHSIERLDLIKLDIEGFEPQALAGAVNTIRKFDPIILMEINPWCIETMEKLTSAHL